MFYLFNYQIIMQVLSYLLIPIHFRYIYMAETFLTDNIQEC